MFRLLSAVCKAQAGRVDVSDETVRFGQFVLGGDLFLLAHNGFAILLLYCG